MTARGIMQKYKKYGKKICPKTASVGCVQNKKHLI